MMELYKKSFFKLPPPFGVLSLQAVSNRLSLDRQRVNSLSVLAYSPISLYKQRES